MKNRVGTRSRAWLIAGARLHIGENNLMTESGKKPLESSLAPRPPALLPAYNHQRPRTQDLPQTLVSVSAEPKLNNDLFALDTRIAHQRMQLLCKESLVRKSTGTGGFSSGNWKGMTWVDTKAIRAPKLVANPAAVCKAASVPSIVVRTTVTLRRGQVESGWVLVPVDECPICSAWICLIRKTLMVATLDPTT
jgi:hypothetical protein